MEPIQSSTSDNRERVFVASTARRIFAVVIDTTLVLLVFVPLSLRATLSRSSLVAGEQLVLPWSSLAAHVVISVGIYGLLLMKMGATPGKRLLGLKVISSEGEPSLSWKQAFGRMLASYLNVVLNVLPWAIAFFNKERRQLADFICGTRVIQAQRRGPVKIRWLIGGVGVLIGLWNLYLVPETAKLYLVSAEGIALRSSAVKPMTAGKSSADPVTEAAGPRCFELQLRSDDSLSSDEKKSKVAETIRVIESRLQEIGATQVRVSHPGPSEDTLLVKASTVAGSVQSLLAKKGLLAMRAVDQTIPRTQLEGLVAKLASDNASELKPSGDYAAYVETLNRLAARLIPTETAIIFDRLVPMPNMPGAPYLVSTNAIFDPSDIATVERKDSPQEPSQLYVRLTPEGASKVERFTGANIGKAIAIEIDQEVSQVSVITGKVPGGVLPLHSGAGSAAEILERTAQLKAILTGGPLPMSVVRIDEGGCKVTAPGD